MEIKETKERSSIAENKKLMSVFNAIQRTFLKRIDKKNFSDPLIMFYHTNIEFKLTLISEFKKKVGKTKSEKSGKYSSSCWRRSLNLSQKITIEILGLGSWHGHVLGYLLELFLEQFLEIWDYGHWTNL